MKKRALLSLSLALALLAGCAPTAEPPGPGPSPSPLPTETASPTAAPEPVRVNFYEFLDGVNAARKTVADQKEPIEIPAEYTPDFHEQNDTFTEEEMEWLTTMHGPKYNLTRGDLIADAETFFTLLRTTYGAYHYFGGDDVFLPLLDAVKEDIAGREVFTAKVLEDILFQRLSPVLIDGHFRIGDRAPRDTFALYMYYVPNLYLDSIEGAENPDYIKPTIGPDGRICWWYAALSHDGSDLPDTLDGRDLKFKWQRALPTNPSEDSAFTVDEWEGVPILTSRRMDAWGTNADADRQALQRLSECGGEYADSPLLIFDVRANGGGSEQYIMGWFRGWAGIGNPARISFVHRYSQLSCRGNGNDYYPSDRMGEYGASARTGTWVERSSPTFVLQDKGTASAGEGAVEFFRMAADTLFVGGPTLGCALVPNNMNFYLPHSGLYCYFGTGLVFCETDENRDGVGYPPDLWVEPTKALDAVKKLIEYYDLNTEQ